MLIFLCNDLILLIQLIKINFINLTNTNKLLFNLNFLYYFIKFIYFSKSSYLLLLDLMIPYLIFSLINSQ